ncbi:unnamed protein product [Orchesella dallaii]|uniref:Uncharacterized protein n=1 Tax=Orchesella dallaii TaxID=48710 RepID=A0ABP1QKB1_9HEXA
MVGQPLYLIPEKERQNPLSILDVSRMNPTVAAQLNFGQHNLQEHRQNRRDIPAAAGANPTVSLTMGGGTPTSVSSIASTHSSSGGVVEVVQKPRPIPQVIPSTSATCAGNQNEANVCANATVDTDLGTTLTLSDVIVAGGYDEPAALRKLETEEIRIPDLVDFLEAAIRDRSTTGNIQGDLNNTLDPSAGTRQANSIELRTDSAPNVVVKDGHDETVYAVKGDRGAYDVTANLN